MVIPRKERAEDGQYHNREAGYDSTAPGIEGRHDGLHGGRIAEILSYLVLGNE